MKFSSISYDMQLLIAEKIDFWSRVQFELSSKEGKRIGNSATQSAVLELKEINCSEQIVTVYFDNPITEKIVEKEWRYVREFKQLPIFSVQHIGINKVSPEYMDSVMNEMKIFNKKGIMMYWDQDHHDEELFVKCVQKFHVKNLEAILIPDTTLVNLPQFQQMDSLDIPYRNFPDEEILSLQAHTINFNKYEDILMHRSIINRFFKQWLQNEREIRSLRLKFERHLQGEELFHDLPARLICSNANLRTYYFDLNERYVLDRGDKKLRIDLTTYILTAMEIENPPAYKNEIDDMEKKGKTQRADSNGVLPNLSWIKIKM